MIHGHGDDIYSYGGKILHNFSTNVYGGFNQDGLKTHLMSVIDTIYSYPEPEPVSLEASLALKEGIRPANVIVTNGATEAIYLIARVFSGSVSNILCPTFSEYADACIMNGHRVNYSTGLLSVAHDAETVWICNPNNPTGIVFDRDTLLGLTDSYPDTTFIIDGAYADYTVKPVITPSDAVERENLILLGSLTKRFAIPGLRVGYAIASTCTINKIKSLRMPWAVNQLAISGGLYLLQHAGEYTVDAQKLNSEALRIAKEFNELGIETSDTDCNILLCRLPKGSSSRLKEYLATNHSMLIRDASNFQGLDTRYFRIAPLTPCENNMLIKSVAQWIRSF